MTHVYSLEAIRRHRDASFAVFFFFFFFHSGVARPAIDGREPRILGPLEGHGGPRHRDRLMYITRVTFSITPGLGGRLSAEVIIFPPSIITGQHTVSDSSKMASKVLLPHTTGADIAYLIQMAWGRFHLTHTTGLVTTYLIQVG